MNDNHTFREQVREDMKLFAERQRQQPGQADRYRIMQSYAERFPNIGFHDIESILLEEAQRAGVHL